MTDVHDAPNAVDLTRAVDACRALITSRFPGEMDVGAAAVLMAVADAGDVAGVRWMLLRDVLPHYWLTAFPDEVPEWTA